jgi:hypothetical protein
MNVLGLTVGTLWDGRLKVWAWTDGGTGFAVKQKVSIEPGAQWTDWANYEAPTLPGQFAVGPMPCAVQLDGGNLAVFVDLLSTNGSLNSSVIMHKTEFAGGGGAASNWAPWPNTPAGYVMLAGCIYGGQLNPNPVSTAGNPKVQFWAVDEASGHWYTSSQGGNPDGTVNWERVSPAPPASASVLWPLYSGNNDDGNGANDQNPGYQGGGDQYLWIGTALGPQPFKLYWLTQGAWKEFSPALEASALGVVSLAACDAAYGGAQVFASDSYGHLWTIWSEPSPSGNGYSWLPAWQKFPLPGGNILPSPYNPADLPISIPTTPRKSLALAQTVTGELQLFAVDTNGKVWTTWKTSTEPGAPWSSWERF